MATRKGIASSRTTIISIAVLDIILITLFLYFSDQFLKDIQSSNNLSTLVISSFAIVIPGTLIILIILQIINLYKSRFKPGNSFKSNIILYYSLTIILVMIPQIVISINFIDSSTNNWLNTRVKKSVQIGLELALNLENESRKELENISSSTFFNEALITLYENRQYETQDLTRLNSVLSTIEVFNNSGSLNFIIGDRGLQSGSIELGKDQSFYPKQKISGREVIKFQYRLIISNRVQFVVLTTELPTDFSKNGSLITSVNRDIQSNSDSINIRYTLFFYYLIFSIPLLLMALLGCFIFSDEVIKPISDIEDAIRTVANGNYSYRILSKKKNEFNILITSFNRMIKEIERSRTKLKHTEQISTWQDIATRLAHEIRNPLTPIKLSAQKVLMKDNSKAMNKHMETIITEVTRMEKLLNEFRDFARFPKLELQPAEIKKTIKDSVNIYRSTYPHIKFDLSGLNEAELVMDKNQIIQVISNLTINAIHAMDGVGTIEITSDLVQKKQQTFCKISVKDSGMGIDKESIPQLFKPYFTTKYNGSGIGLAIVNKIVIDHKGKVWVESAPGVGTTFYIELPKENI